MRWLQVETTRGHPEPALLESIMAALGAEAVWLRDAGDEPVLEPAPGETPLWSESLVTALFPIETERATIVSGLSELISASDLLFRVIEEQNWQANWQADLRPLQFGNRLWILPDAAHTAPDNSVIVRLAPGMAFGTGEHPTTAMCLKWLESQELAGSNVLDYGCGSGLLSIAALALGANSACGTDIDQQALDATRANAQNNGCGQRITICVPEEMPPKHTYDFLVANILSNTLIALGPQLRDHMRAGAPLALAGVLSDQAADVCDAWSEWADLAVSDQTDEWVLLTGYKRNK